MSKVLWYITGQRYLPVGGFNAFFITPHDGKNCMEIGSLISIEDGSSRVDITPRAQTCAQQILFPFYTSYEKFVFFMNKALEHGVRMDAL